jgi:hypothetical protein
MNWEEGQVIPCPYCGRECIVQHGKLMDSVTHKQHTCEQYKKAKAAENPKRGKTLADRQRDRNHPFIVERYCGWCGARWIYNEALPSKQWLTHCPNCCNKMGLPNPDYQHPKYGVIAMVEWAKSQKKLIPKHILKQYHEAVQRTTKE